MLMVPKLMGMGTRVVIRMVIVFVGRHEGHGQM